MDNRAFASATELSDEIRDGRIGCVELLDFFLTRAERHNPVLNAIVVWQIDQARERARAADAALARGERWGPLHGIPMTVKESFNVAGLATTFGNPLWKDNIAAGNGFLIDRLLQAGAIVFGKTNVPYMLADAQSYNDIYGITNNPWDLTRSPGGSSGGEAATLAAGLSALGAGSDIAGSLRNPAHYCGIYGHKPSWGLISPMTPAATSISGSTAIAAASTRDPWPIATMVLVPTARPSSTHSRASAFIATGGRRPRRSISIRSCSGTRTRRDTRTGA
jgi:amidase